MDTIRFEIDIVNKLDRDEMEVFVFHKEEETGKAFKTKDYDELDKTPFMKDCFELTLFINEEPIHLFTNLRRVLRLYSFKIPELKRDDVSLFTSEYCDIPEDEGISVGLEIEQRERTVHWMIPDRRTKMFFGATEYVFDKKQYANEIKRVWRFMYDNLSPDIANSSLFDGSVNDIMARIKRDSPIYYLNIWESHEPD